METSPAPQQIENDKVISDALSDLAESVSWDAPAQQLAETVKAVDAVQDWSMSPIAAAAGHVATDSEAIKPTAEEIAAKKLWPDAVPDPRIAVLESDNLQQGIKIANLEAQVRVLNEKLVAMRKAKDGYKAIASQGVKDLVYVKKMVGMVYAERRADEMQKEFAAVKDE